MSEKQVDIKKVDSALEGLHASAEGLLLLVSDKSPELVEKVREHRDYINAVRITLNGAAS